jgi:predicted transcriptional regulator
VNGNPAVPRARSVTPHAVFCLDFGKRLKALKRHLWSASRLNLEQYRARWDLASDFPMVAPSYAKRRSGLARLMGVGTETGRGRKKPLVPALAPGA